MRHWELDFGALVKPVEFMSVVDRGTSILVSTAATEHYNGTAGSRPTAAHLWATQQTAL